MFWNSYCYVTTNTTRVKNPKVKKVFTVKVLNINFKGTTLLFSVMCYINYS